MVGRSFLRLGFDFLRLFSLNLEPEEEEERTRLIARARLESSASELVVVDTCDPLSLLTESAAITSLSRLFDSVSSVSRAGVLIF